MGQKHKFDSDPLLSFRGFSISHKPASSFKQDKTLAFVFDHWLRESQFIESAQQDAGKAVGSIEALVSGTGCEV